MLPRRDQVAVIEGSIAADLARARARHDPLQRQLSMASTTFSVVVTHKHGQSDMRHPNYPHTNTRRCRDISNRRFGTADASDRASQNATHLPPFVSQLSPPLFPPSEPSPRPA